MSDDKKLEELIQFKCVEWFNETYPDYRMRLYHNFQNPKDAIQGSFLIGQGLRKGVADLTLMIPQGVVYIEMKTPKGTQKPDQCKFQKECDKLNTPYHIARSLQDFQNIIKIYYPL